MTSRPGYYRVRKGKGANIQRPITSCIKTWKRGRGPNGGKVIVGK